MGEAPTVTIPVIHNTSPAPVNEPPVEEASRLLLEINGMGTVARLGRVHDALVDAFRRGRASAQRTP